jgi:hypothetical protein
MFELEKMRPDVRYISTDSDNWGTHWAYLVSAGVLGERLGERTILQTTKASSHSRVPAPRYDETTPTTSNESISTIHHV